MCSSDLKKTCQYLTCFFVSLLPVVPLVVRCLEANALMCCVLCRLSYEVTQSKYKVIENSPFLTFVITFLPPVPSVTFLPLPTPPPTSVGSSTGPLNEFSTHVFRHVLHVFSFGLVLRTLLGNLHPSNPSGLYDTKSLPLNRSYPQPTVADSCPSVASDVL